MPHEDAPGHRISRRTLLRAGATSAAISALGGVGAFIAACSSQTSPEPSSASTAPSPSPSAGGPLSTPSETASASPSPPGSLAPTPSPGGPSLEAKIAGLMIVGFRGSRLAQTPWIAADLRERGLRGVILFDRDQLTGAQRNVLSPAQVRTLVRDLRAAARGRPIVVSIDQEGGIVTRLSPAHGFPAVASEREIGSGTVATARRWAATIASTLADAGIDLDYAPVVDLDVNPRSPAIGGLDRSFSADPAVVVRMATIEINALRAAGVRSAMKHFPGIGSSTANTDFGVADVTKTWKRVELEPFRQLIAAGTADVVMAGHVVNGQLDPDRPASLSRPIVTDLLRGELGWDGVVVTDDLQAAAITRQFGRDEAVLLALEAGNDLLLFANQQAYDKTLVERVVRVVGGAVRSGRLSAARIDEAWTRVERTFGGTS